MSTVPSSSILSLSIKEAYDIYQKHSEGTHKLWAYFSAVSLAVLGYTIGTDKNDWTPLTFVVIGLCYFLFAFGNRHILIESQKEVERFASLFNSLAGMPSGSTTGPIVVSVTAVDHRTANEFHWGATVVVLLSIGLTLVQKT